MSIKKQVLENLISKEGKKKKEKYYPKKDMMEEMEEMEEDMMEAPVKATIMADSPEGIKKAAEKLPEILDKSKEFMKARLKKKS